MQCFNPIPMTIEVGGKEYKQVPVPCGKCEACLARRARDWMIRLTEELKDSSYACFVTLTYDDEHLPRQDRKVYDWMIDQEVTFKDVPVHRVRDCQLFLKRLRKDNPDVKIRYFLVSEFGPRTLRPHYHAIVFNLPRERCNKMYISSKWQNGFVEVSKVTEGRIAYVTKYCFGSTTLPYWLPKNITKMSLKPAIGYKWYENYKKQLESVDEHEAHYFVNGYRLPAPAYYVRRFEKEFQGSMLEDELNEYKQSKMEDYLDSLYYQHLNDLEEIVERQKEYEETGRWRETSKESKERTFKERFYKKYNKNRKL